MTIVLTCVDDIMFEATRTHELLQGNTVPSIDTVHANIEDTTYLRIRSIDKEHCILENTRIDIINNFNI